MPGLTYFVRFWSANNSTFINFNFCIQDAPPPPANDECSAAIPLIINPFGTSCTNTTNVVTNGATQSPFTPLTCTSIDNDNNDDVWYSFVATSQSVILRASNIISSITGSNASAAYALYQSACPGSAATFSCDGQFAFSAGHRIISGLTVGNTYFLRLWIQGLNNYGTMNICVQETRHRHLTMNAVLQYH